MSKLERLKQKAKALEAKDPKGAIEAWLEAAKVQETEAEPDPDLAIFNRIGDLYLKLKDTASAADSYDRAVDKYAERGLHNNAIAMCNKVLRNAPGRQTTYLKLAKLYAAKGFIAEATQNFVEYAERMQKAGKIQHAFSALKELTDIVPESALFRKMLEDHLQMYGDTERRPPIRASGPVAPPEQRPDRDKGGKGKSSSLVFLDVAAPARSKLGPGAKAPPPPPPAPPPPQPPPRPASQPPAPPLRARSPEPLLQDQDDKPIEPVPAEPDASLEVEPTSVADEPESATGGTLDGFEATMVEFEDAGAAASAPGPPLLYGDEEPSGVAHMAELEPTVPEEPGAGEESSVEAEVGFEPLPDSEIEVQPPPAPGLAPAAPVAAEPAGPRRSTGLPGASPYGPSKRKPVVDVPPLELEPDFDTKAPRGRRKVDEEDLAPNEIPPTGGFRQAEEGGPGDEVDEGSELAFADIDAMAPAAPTVEELEARVADNPDDPGTHQALGEALIEAGDRERGIEELDHATLGFETLGQFAEAHALVDEILRLEPNSVRHRQKQVEFAFQSGDKKQLIDAYLELADALLRQDLPDKARAVYQRITEHDPTNERANAALVMFAPVTPPPAPEPEVRQSKREGKVAPRDAKMKVRDEASEEGEFVDLAAMILDEQPATRDPRMKVADEEPTGDEERDFHEMLARFRQGIDENIDETDFQSHYDLGVAFKEMGLLDEAIAEFQKALRAPEGKLKSSEALGACFFEKRAYVVAESILRRALELPGPGDEGRLGILYWLGRALEEQGKKVEARALYGRVFAVDIRFRDVGERARALARAK